MKKRWLAMSMVFALAVSMIGQTGATAVYATPTDTENAEEKQGEKELSDLEIASRMVNNYEDIDIKPPLSISQYAGGIPATIADSESLASKYDPRGDANIPAIRNQGSLGTCWAHGVQSMIEMDLWKQGKLNGNDMSEFQTVYFMNHNWEDPLNLCTNDNFHAVDSKGDSALSKTWYTRGCNTAYTKFMLMDWVGAVSETEYSNTAYSVLLTNKENAVLDKDFAIKNDSAHIQDVTVINTEDMNVIKEMVQEHGAVEVDYWSDQTTADNGTGEEVYYNEANAAYYFDGYKNVDKKDRTINHAVAIVGWDDDFPKEKFNEDHQPERNGAWLARNSWGTWGDGGYFWLSYEDTSIDEVAYVMQAAARDSEDYYDHNYQYDGGISLSSISYASAAEQYRDKYEGMQMANVFTAQQDEILKAVAIYTGANYGYTVQIYKGISDQTNPIQGEPVYEQSGVQLFEGYHTVKLDSEIELNIGDIFSVVVTLRDQNNIKDTSIWVDKNLSTDSRCSVIEAKAGESFYRCLIEGCNLNWNDASQASDPRNVRIKAYTDDIAPKTPATISNKTDKDGYQLSYTYGMDLPTPSQEHFTTTNQDTGADWTFVWYAGDQTDGNIDLSDESKLENIPSDAGTYTLVATVSSKNYETASVRLKVEIAQATLTKDDFEATLPETVVYDGKSHPATVTCSKLPESDKFTWKYQYKKDTSSDFTDLAENAEPTEPGMYKVMVDFTGNKNIAAVTDLEVGSFTIAKGEALTIAPENKSYIYSSGSKGAVTLDLPEKFSGIDIGKVTYTITKTEDTQNILDGNPTISDKGILQYTVKPMTDYQAGVKAVITITIGSDRYEDSTYTLTIQLSEKRLVKPQNDATVTLQNNQLIEGQSLSALTFTNITFVDSESGEIVGGTLAFTDPDAVPGIGTTTAEWVFTPTDSEYAAYTGNVSITVLSKTISITNKDYAISYAYGEPISMPAKENFTIDPAIESADENLTWSFTWKNSDGTTLTTAPSDAGTYTLVTAVSHSDSRSGELETTISILPLTLTAADFQTALPGNGTVKYSGQPQMATVTCTKLSNFTDFTVKYQVESVSEITETAPTEPGIYQVIISVPGDGKNITAADISIGTFTITKKAAFEVTETRKHTYSEGNTQPEEGSIDLVADLELPEDMGETEYSITVEDTEGILSGDPVPAIKNGILTYAVNTAREEAVGSEAILTVSVQSAHYEDFTIKLTIRLMPYRIPVTLSGIEFPQTGVYSGQHFAYNGEPVWKTEAGEEVSVSDTEVLYKGVNGTTYSSSDAPVHVGDYRVTISVKETDETYAGEMTSETFSITKKPITITAADKNITVGDELPSLENAVQGTDYTVEGLISGDILDGTPVLSYTDESGAAVQPDNSKEGVYQIRISGLEHLDYRINYQAGTLTIKTKSSITPTESPSPGATNTPSPGATDTPSKPSIPGTETITPTPGAINTPTPTPGVTNIPGEPTLTPSVTDTPVKPTPTPEEPKTTVTENPDGSTTETTTSTKTTEDGSVIQTTEVVQKDPSGKTTGSSITSIITTGFEDEKTSITVAVKKNAKGSITNATASISGKTVSGTQKALIQGSMVRQIVQTAGTNKVEINVQNQNSAYTVIANASDLTAGRKLNIVQKKANGTYILVNAKTYTVTKNGDVFASINGKKTYEFISRSKMKELSSGILKTIKVKKASKTVKKSKTVKMGLKNTLKMANVKSIQYTVSKKAVAKVNQKGIVTGKKAGTAIVKAKVTLKNGRTKTVRMKITVKK